MKDCPKCGATLPAENQPCPACATSPKNPADSPPIPAPPVLDYRPLLKPRASAKFLWIAMIVIAVLALHLFVILLFNPTLELAAWLGGGIGGTPFSPATITDASGHIDGQAEQKIYWMRAAPYLFLFLLTQWLFLTPRGS